MAKGKDPRDFEYRKGFTLANCRNMFEHFFDPYYLGCQKNLKHKRFDVILRTPKHSTPEGQQYLASKLLADVQKFTKKFNVKAGRPEEYFKFFFHDD